MHRLATLGLAALFVLSTFVGLAAADTRIGGATVGENERVDAITAVGGPVVIEGTVNGDLRVYGGSVHIAEGASVQGQVRVYGGDAVVDGSVGENVLVTAGSLQLGETGSVDGSFGTVAGPLTVAGTVGGDATAVVGPMTLESTAHVEEDVFYTGEFTDRGATVDGATMSVWELSLLPPFEAFALALGLVLFVSDLVLGVVLLALAPDFADSAVETVTAEPFRTVGIGLAAIAITLFGMLVLALTIVGIPLAIAVLMLALVAAWIAGVYGQYVVGTQLLALVETDNRYLALFVGVLAVTILGLVPYLGPVVQFLVFLVGAGIVALGLLRAYDLIAGSRGGMAAL